MNDITKKIKFLKMMCSKISKESWAIANIKYSIDTKTLLIITA